MTGVLSRRPVDTDAAGPRRSAPRPLIIAGAVLLVVVALVWVVAFSPLLGVRTVTVRGAAQVGAQQISEVAAVRAGTPLMRLSTGAVRSRVAALPGIASVRVSVSYPSTVVITVVERVAVGYLHAGSSYLLVDRTGLQFQTVSSAPGALPRFDVPDGAAGRGAGRDAAAVAGTLSVAVRAQLADIQANSAGDVTLTLRDGRMVVWGSARNDAGNTAKASLLGTVLQQPGKIFDLSNPGLVVAR